MKTKLEKFNEILSILRLNYQVNQTYADSATITTDGVEAIINPRSSTKTSYVNLELNGDVIYVYTGGEVSHVFYLDDDEISVGIRTLDIENIIIQYFKLKHGPLALTTYLYCTLLGMLWGMKASSNIKDKDPLPDQSMFIRLYGRKAKKQVIYEYDYIACTDGTIKITKSCSAYSQTETFNFHVLEYLEDPVKTTQQFFKFFNDIDFIEKAGKG